MTDLNKSEALSHSDLCAELDDAEREVLAGRCGVRHLKDGETLARHGEAPRTLFILASGKLDICKPGREGPEPVYAMGPGEVAGTRSFIDGVPRQATVLVRGDSSVLTLEPDDFEALLEPHPWIVYKVMRGMFRVTHRNLMRMNKETDELQGYFLRTGGRY